MENECAAVMSSENPVVFRAADEIAEVLARNHISVRDIALVYNRVESLLTVDYPHPTTNG